MWNTHKIRSTRNQLSHCGRPMLMYDMPDLYRTSDCLCEVEPGAIDSLEESCKFEVLPCDGAMFDVIWCVMEDLEWPWKDDIFDIVNLYIRVRRIIYSLL